LSLVTKGTLSSGLRRLAGNGYNGCMSDFETVLRETFGGMPFTALNVLSVVPESSLPSSTQYAISRRDRGMGKDMVARSIGQILSHMDGVELVGKVSSGKRLWRCRPVL
jgi:hypothetical protein